MSDLEHTSEEFPIEYIDMRQFDCLLNKIEKPPRGLYMRGNIDILRSDQLMVCIIGSRRHSQYGETVVKSLIHYLAPYNPVIISGLATGIDTLALQYALEKDLHCIAILGSGLDDDSIYPRENIPLAHTIIKNSGLLISEHPAKTKAIKWHFPARNRIMAGLSKAIIIVEGGRKSGTLITARLGLDFNREIISVPGSIFSELSTGPISLIQHGAIPLSHPSEIIDILGLRDNAAIQPELKLREEAMLHERYSRCSVDEKKIMETLVQPIDRNDLLIKTSFEIQKLQVLLTTLEVKGFITEKYGKIVRL